MADLVTSYRQPVTSSSGRSAMADLGHAGSAPGPQSAEADVVGWLQQKLLEERKEVERMLLQRHEDILLHLRQSPQLQAMEGNGRHAAFAQQVTEGTPLLREHAASDELPPGVLPDWEQSPGAARRLQKLAAADEGNRRHVAFEDVGGAANEQPGFFSSEDVASPPGIVPEEDASLMSVEKVESMVSRDRFRRAASGMKRSMTTIETILDEIPAGPESLSTWERMSSEFLELKLDMISGFVIILYVILIALKAQYNGFELAHNLAPDLEQFQGSLPAEEVWPHAREVFFALEWVFCAFFIAELALRMIFKIRVWPDRYWNGFDAIVIVLFIVEQCLPANVMEATFKFDPTIMRMARLIKLLRLLKLVRYVKSMGALLLICKAIMSTLSVLGYSVTVIFLLMMVTSVVIASILDVFIRDPLQDAAMRGEAFQRWGSFWRALLSMFEITLANWGPHCWFLVNNVSEAWGLFFCVWKCIVGFAVIQVISSVFIQHTFKCASRDEDVMIQEKSKARENYMEHVDRLFSKLSTTTTYGSSFNQEEFQKALQKDRVKDWFGALDIEVSDAAMVFNMLDTGDGEVGKDEFIDGLRQLKGPAKSIDMVQVMRDCSKIRESLDIPTSPHCSR